MRTRGWRGDPPSSDQEARERIIAATFKCIDRFGAAKTGLTDVANELGVTRQTVYRYFSGTDDLLNSAAIVAAAPFLNAVEAHCAHLEDPVDAAVESIAYAIELLPNDHLLWTWLGTGSDATSTQAMTSPVAVEFAGAIIGRLPVDWSGLGYSSDEFDELIEFMLRLLRSLVFDPGVPPRDPEATRSFLYRWVGPAIGAPVGRSSRALVER